MCKECRFIFFYLGSVLAYINLFRSAIVLCLHPVFTLVGSTPYALDVIRQIDKQTNRVFLICPLRLIAGSLTFSSL
jgi:hypothetical protein